MIAFIFAVALGLGGIATHHGDSDFACLPAGFAAELKAQNCFMLAPEDILVGGNCTAIQTQIPLPNRQLIFHGKDGLFFNFRVEVLTSAWGQIQARRLFVDPIVFIERPNPAFGTHDYGTAKANVDGWATTEILDDHNSGRPSPRMKLGFVDFKKEVGSDLSPTDFSGDLVRLAGFTKGSPDQGYPDDTEYYPENRRSTHDNSPPGSGFLGHKIALAALVCAVFLMCLCNAVRFFRDGRTEAGIISWVIGGLGILGTAAVGVPLALELGPPSIPRDGSAYEYRNYDNSD